MSMLLSFLFVSMQSMAINEKSCGVYLLHGHLKKIKSSFAFVVNEGSRDEVHFIVPSSKDFMKISANLNQPLIMKAVLKKPFQAGTNNIYDLSDIRLRPFQPLKDKGYRQVLTRTCQR